MRFNPSGADREDDHVSMGSRLQAEDQSVLEDILRAFGPMVCALLMKKFPRMLTCIDDAEDILLIALHTIWTNRKRFDPNRSKLSRWLYYLAEHAAIDQSRQPWQRARSRELNSRDLSEFKSVVGADSEVDDANLNVSYEKRDIAEDEKRHIAEVVSRLSDIDRMIIEAKALAGEGESWAANLAPEISWPASKIRARLFKIRKKIAGEMERRRYNIEQVQRAKAQNLPSNIISDKMGGSPDDK